MFKVNEYFGGNVKSLSFTSPDGPATVGVMAPGEYEFNTSSRETMRVVAGSLAFKLPTQASWTTCEPGQAFVIEANQKFTVRAARESAYLCLFG